MRNFEYKRKQFIALLIAIILRFGEITQLATAEGIDFVVDEDDGLCYSTDNPSYAELGYGDHRPDLENLTILDCLTGRASTTCIYCGKPLETETDPRPSHSLTKTEGSSPTCTQDGHEPYWTCDVCHTTFSSADATEDFECTLSDLVIEATGHKPCEPAPENVVDATCSEAGSYDMVTRCEKCKEILSSEHITTGINAEKHTPGDPAPENTVDGTCSNAGSYDLVTRCKDCKEVISSQHIDTDKNAEKHTPGDPIPENTVDGTCSNAGSYDLVTRCKDCKEVISSQHIDTDINAEKHDWGDWIVVSEAGGIRTLRRECKRDTSHFEEKQETIVVQTQQEDPTPPRDSQQQTQGQQVAGGEKDEVKTEASANPQIQNGKVQNTDADLSGANAGESTVSMNNYAVLLNDKEALDKTQVFVSHIKTESADLSDTASSGAVVFVEPHPIGVTNGSDIVYQTNLCEYDQQTGTTKNLQASDGMIEIVGETFAGQSEIMDRTKEILFAGNMDVFLENADHATVVAGDASSMATVTAGKGDVVVENADHATVVAGDASSMATVTAGKGDVAVEKADQATVTAGNLTGATITGGDASSYEAVLNGTAEDITITDGTGNNLSKDAVGTVGWKEKEDTLTGDAGNDILFGGAGNDTLLGGAGDDAISLVLDNDSIREGKGYTTISGGAGDHFYYYGGSGEHTVSAGSPWKDSFSINLNESEDFPNIDSLLSGSVHDTLVGDSAKDTIIAGTSGHNTLWGGAGSNILLRDTLEGRSETDAFFYGGEGNDTIKAFSSADDTDILYDFTAVNRHVDESSYVNLSTVSDGLLTVSPKDGRVVIDTGHTVNGNNSGAFGD